MAAVQMPPPLVHRPSMDRSSSSYDSASGSGGSSSTRRQYTSSSSLGSNYDQLQHQHRATSPIPRQTYSPSPLGGHPHPHAHAHIRTNSNSSSKVSTPYAQPYPSTSTSTNGYFALPQIPLQPHHPHAHPHGQYSFQHTPPLSAYPQVQIPTPTAPATAWTATPIPASAFYPTASVPGSGFTYNSPNLSQSQSQVGQQVPQVFHQGFQQSQADFAIWAHAHAAAYQHMVMASVAQQQQQQQYQQQQQQEILALQGQGQGQEEENEGLRRRIDSNSHSNSGAGGYHQLQQHRRPSLPDDRSVSPSLAFLATQQAQPRSVSDKQPQQNQQTGGFHPYKRTPGHRPSRENIRANPVVTALPRSKSQPALSAVAAASALKPREADKQPQHNRTSSLDSHLSGSTIQPRPSVGDENRRDSSVTERAVKVSNPPTSVTPVAIPTTTFVSASAAASTPTAAAAPAPRPKTSRAPAPAPTPLVSGPISSATNTRPSGSGLTASNSSTSLSGAEKSKSSGGGFLKSRLVKALHKDKAAREAGGIKSSTSASSISSMAGNASRPAPAPAVMSSPPTKSTHSSYPNPHTSPSETSTRSGTPPQTPPHPPPFHPHSHSHGDLHPPSAPFAQGPGQIGLHHRAMDSEVSLAETGRTERIAEEDGGGGKTKKKGLFRMKNMSTDNISLSSTVSSASMMIRKMGSIGKLARRNSLMGISKIFKDKAKDEDAALPEIDGKKRDKQAKKEEKKAAKEAAAAAKKGKGELAPVEVVRASAEAENNEEGDGDDRALAGLSPAAKLARQHTLKSKADEAKRLSQRSAGAAAASGPGLNGGGGGTGEPTWDNNTVTTSRSSALPSLGSVLPLPHVNGGNGNGNANGGPEVMLIQPRHTSGSSSTHGSRNISGPKVQHAHAVAVSEAEYDSEDDNSSSSSDEEEGDEMVEDVRERMGRVAMGSAGSGGYTGGSGGYTGVEGHETEREKHDRDLEFRSIWGNTYIDKGAVPKKSILKVTPSPYKDNVSASTSTSTVQSPSTTDPAHIPRPNILTEQPGNGVRSAAASPSPTDSKGQSQNRPHLDFDFSFDTPSPSLDLDLNLKHPNSSAPSVSTSQHQHAAVRSMTLPVPNASRRLRYAPDVAVYRTYDPDTYDRKSEPATCNKLTPDLAKFIKHELNAFKLEMPVHPDSREYTHFFSW